MLIILKRTPTIGQTKVRIQNVTAIYLLSAEIFHYVLMWWANQTPDKQTEHAIPKSQIQFIIKSNLF